MKGSGSFSKFNLISNCARSSTLFSLCRSQQVYLNCISMPSRAADLQAQKTWLSPWFHLHFLWRDCEDPGDRGQPRARLELTFPGHCPGHRWKGLPTFPARVTRVLRYCHVPSSIHFRLLGEHLENRIYREEQWRWCFPAVPRLPGSCGAVCWEAQQGWHFFTVPSSGVVCWQPAVSCFLSRGAERFYVFTWVCERHKGRVAYNVQRELAATLPFPSRAAIWLSECFPWFLSCSPDTTNLLMQPIYNFCMFICV